MTDTPSIDLEIADGTYRFALPAGAQHNVERLCRLPFGSVAARVMRGRFPVDENATAGLITEAEFGAFDFDAIITEGLIAGGWASKPGHPNYKMEKGDIIGWFGDRYLRRWTIEQKWTIAAAVIGSAFYGHPAAANLPKTVSIEGDERADVDDAGGAAGEKG